VYPIHYLNIVVPDKSLDSVYLDNTLLPSTTFTSIPNSGFSYAILNIKEGVHTLRSNQAIGGFVYGYGNAISYGYGLGLRFKKIDNNEPVISGKRDCYQYNARIFDTLFADSYIEKILCPDSSNINIKIENQFGLLTQKGWLYCVIDQSFFGWIVLCYCRRFYATTSKKKNCYSRVYGFCAKQKKKTHFPQWKKHYAPTGDFAFLSL
jgi:hypothetical protein